MTTKEWLNRGWKINCNINSLLEEQKNIPTHDRYKEYSETINKKIDELYDIKNEIEYTIEKVDDHILQTLLRERYIKFASWETIAEIIHYESVRWVRTAVHNRALQSLQKIITDC